MADDAIQVRRAVLLAVQVDDWLRDEEATSTAESARAIRSSWRLDTIRPGLLNWLGHVGVLKCTCLASGSFWASCFG